MGNYISIIYSKIANWQEPVCSLHEKQLEFYCNVCKTPICEYCTFDNHEEAKGKHEPIRASDVFNDFKATADSLIIQADVHKHQAQVGISKCIANVSNLNKTRNDITKDINDTVEEIVRLVRESGAALERKLGDICETKEKECNSQIDELKSYIRDVDDKQDCIKNLLTCGKATALLTCHQAIQELQQKIVVPSGTESRNDGKVYFFPTNADLLKSLKKQGIGYVSEKPNENIFEILSENPMTVTCYQPFHVEIAQRDKCEIDVKDLAVSKKEITPSSTKDASPTTRIVESQGKYFVEGSSSTDLTLDVKFCNSSIKGSPIKIIVEPVGIVKFIKNVGHSTGNMGNSHKGIQDLVMFENGCFLVLCTCKCEIFKFKNSGAFISRITLPKSTQIERVWKLKNNLICAGSEIKEKYNKYAYKSEILSLPKIYFLSPDGQVIWTKSIYGDQKQHFPFGIDVNEVLNLLCLAHKTQNCVNVYYYGNRTLCMTIGSKGDLEGQMKGPSDVAVTKEGNVIVADTDNHRVQLFGTDGQFIKVLIGGGREDGMVIRPYIVDVDNDDNIIVASEGKVQLFDKHGKFIQVFHQIDEGEDKNFVFSIASYFPRRLALAEVNSTTISLINY
ncbi:tripartite motif-containing protein 2-like [Anneissia japonica]|uniref:tripartite motif-containing protein 2-like n=1 Tax=Anneissia japonica TaxID=1529436 RepID=UPI0014256E35|nr:tripartite motif-containing protein 2-like [Anneissia japonica]